MISSPTVPGAGFQLLRFARSQASWSTFRLLWVLFPALQVRQSTADDLQPLWHPRDLAWISRTCSWALWICFLFPSGLFLGCYSMAATSPSFFFYFLNDLSRQTTVTLSAYNLIPFTMIEKSADSSTA